MRTAFGKEAQTGGSNQHHSGSRRFKPELRTGNRPEIVQKSSGNRLEIVQKSFGNHSKTKQNKTRPECHVRNPTSLKSPPRFILFCFVGSRTRPSEIDKKNQNKTKQNAARQQILSYLPRFVSTIENQRASDRQHSK